MTEPEISPDTGLPVGMSPTTAPTTTQLASLSDDQLRGVLDWWSVGNSPVVGYQFWLDELNRRAAERLKALLAMR
jgi:hypothetical protein